MSGSLASPPAPDGSGLGAGVARPGSGPDGMADFAQPTYIHPDAASLLLSESRPLQAAPVLLHAVNLLVDELLWLALDACSDPGHTEAERIKLAAAGRPVDAPLKGTIPWPLTTAEFKKALLKVLGNGVGKNAVLEAELAVRELLKTAPSEARRDPALSAAPGPKTSRARVEVVFSELRGWCDRLSPLGERFNRPRTYSTASSLLDTVLPVLLDPTSLASVQASSHLVTPGLALWTTAVLGFLGEYVIRGVSRVVERDPTHAIASPADLLVFTGEDEGGIWSAFEGMRVRAFVEREVVAASAGAHHSHSHSQSSGDRPRRDTLTKSKARPSTAGSERKRSEGPTSEGRPSLTNTASTADTSIVTTASGGVGPGSRPKSAGSTLKRIGSLSKAREGRMRSASNRSGKSGGTSPSEDTQNGDGADEAFEELMLSGKTMKVSLTPGRLKTMELFDKDKGSTTLKLLPDVSPKTTPAPLSTSETKDVEYPFPSTPSRRAGGGRSGVGPKLVARSPLKVREDLEELEEEEEEGELDSEDERMGYKRKPPAQKKESLADILNSPPPWGDDESPFADFQKSVAGTQAAPKSSTVSPVSSVSLSKGPTTSTTPGRGAAMMLGRPLEPQTETKRTDLRDLAAFFAQGPPPGLMHQPAESEVSLLDSADPISNGKPKRKGLKGMMSRLRSKDGEEEKGGVKAPNGRAPGLVSPPLRQQRSSPILRQIGLSSTDVPAPAIPAVPIQHRPSSAKRPGSAGRNLPLLSAIPLSSSHSSPRSSPTLELPSSALGLGGSVDHTPTLGPNRPVSAGATSPRRKPVPLLDETTLDIVAGDAPATPSRERESSCSTELSQTASLETAPSRVESRSIDPISANVLLGLHTPPPSDTGLAALAAGSGPVAAVAKEIARPLTPPASPPRQDDSGLVVVAASEDQPSAPPIEHDHVLLGRLRQQMVQCSTVAECLALVDLAISGGSQNAPEAATQTEAEEEDVESSGDDEATVMAWLFGELPQLSRPTSDPSSTPESEILTGKMSPIPPKEVPREPSLDTRTAANDTDTTTDVSRSDRTPLLVAA